MATFLFWFLVILGALVLLNVTTYFVFKTKPGEIWKLKISLWFIYSLDPKRKRLNEIRYRKMFSIIDATRDIKAAHCITKKLTYIEIWEFTEKFKKRDDQLKQMMNDINLLKQLLEYKSTSKT